MVSAVAHSCVLHGRSNTRTEQNTRSRTRPRRLHLTTLLAGAPGLFRLSRAVIPVIRGAPSEPAAARNRRAHKVQPPSSRTCGSTRIITHIAGDLYVSAASQNCRWWAPLQPSQATTLSDQMAISGLVQMAASGQIHLSADTSADQLTHGDMRHQQVELVTPCIRATSLRLVEFRLCSGLTMCGRGCGRVCRDQYFSGVM